MELPFLSPWFCFHYVSLVTEGQGDFSRILFLKYFLLLLPCNNQYSDLMFVVVDQSPSCVQLCDSMNCSTPGFPVLHHLPEFAQIHVHWVSDAIQPSDPLSSPSSAFNLSQHQGLSQWVSSSCEVAKVLELQLQHQSFSKDSALISFRIDWFDLLGVQGTPKSLLQQHGSKASILRCSEFFTVQLSHPHMTTGKTIALTIQIFVGKVMSLLFNMLSRFVIVFLPRSKHLLILGLQSPSAVIFGTPKNKVCHCFHCFPIYLPWSDGTGCHDLSFLNVEF